MRNVQRHNGECSNTFCFVFALVSFCHFFPADKFILFVLPWTLPSVTKCGDRYHDWYYDCQIWWLISRLPDIMIDITIASLYHAQMARHSAATATRLDIQFKNGMSQLHATPGRGPIKRHYVSPTDGIIYSLDSVRNYNSVNYPPASCQAASGLNNSRLLIGVYRKKAALMLADWIF